MTKRKTPPKGDYEVGYGKPPKATQFKASDKQKRRDKQIDIVKVINEPVAVTKDGVTQDMPASEVKLRAQVSKAMKEQNLGAIHFVLKCAERYGLIKPPMLPLHSGGVLVVPGRLSEDEWNALFKDEEERKKIARTRKGKKL